MVYELNFYPTEAGDGFYIRCKTKAQALKDYKRLQGKYPHRTGDAFIRVWDQDPALDDSAEPVRDIDL